MEECMQDCIMRVKLVLVQSNNLNLLVPDKGQQCLFLQMEAFLPG
jgi:hypothetical protein